MYKENMTNTVLKLNILPFYAHNVTKKGTHTQKSNQIIYLLNCTFITITHLMTMCTEMSEGYKTVQKWNFYKNKYIYMIIKQKIVLWFLFPCICTFFKVCLLYPNVKHKSFTHKLKMSIIIKNKPQEIPEWSRIEL